MKKLAVLSLVSLLVLTLTAPVMAQGGSSECPDAPSPRLVIGLQARVSPGPPNNLRDQPTSGGALLGGIPGGEAFVVLDGPVCADGYHWWQVNYGGTIGWTTEGAPGEYWLEPVTPDVAPITGNNAYQVTLLGVLTDETVQQIAFSPDGRVLAYAVASGNIVLWDTQMRQQRAALAGHGPDPASAMPFITFSPDSSLLVSAGLEGTLRVWDVETGLLQSLAYNASADGDEWVVLHGDEARNAGDVTGSTLLITPFISPSGTRLAFTRWHRYNENAPVYVWGFPSLLPENTYFGVRDLRSFVPERPSEGSTAGQRIFMTVGVSSENEAAQVWQVDTNAIQTYGDAGDILSLAASPDGRLMAVSLRETARLYDLDTASELHVLEAGGHLTFSPDGDLLAVHSVEPERLVCVFNMETGAQIGMIESRVAALAFIPDNDLLVTANHDGLVIIYGTRTFAAVSENATGYWQQTYRLAVSPDGRWIATAGINTPLQLWGVPQG